MKLKQIIILILIIALAAILRLYNLGNNPPSLDWDEASLGWNAYSILKTGTDEYGKAWPVSIRSFNDYKPPLYVYAAVPSIAIFGLNEFSVRFPSAVAGVLTVLLAFFLVRRLTKNNLLGYCVTGLLAISPWSIQFSRVAFEANLALLFFVTGNLFLTSYLFEVTKPKKLYLYLALFAFLASIYSYHSSRIVIPMFLVGVGLYYRKIFLSIWKTVLVLAILGLVFLFPLAKNTLTVKGGTARFSEVSIITSENLQRGPVAISTLFAKNYLDQFNFDFLFLKGDSNGRHHAPDMGLFYLVEFPFLLAGLYFLFKEKPPWRFFILWWLITAPITAAITKTSPHAVRSLMMLPALEIIVGYGLIKSLNRRFLIFISCFLFLGNFVYYFHQYYVHYPIESAPDWQYGYKQVVKKVIDLQQNYDRIYITSHYDQPYIYFLFYGQIDPNIKNNTFFYKELGKYEFLPENTLKKGFLIIAPEEKIPGFTTLDQVNYPTGSPAFLLGTYK